MKIKTSIVEKGLRLRGQTGALVDRAFLKLAFPAPKSPRDHKKFRSLLTEAGEFYKTHEKDLFQIPLPAAPIERTIKNKNPVISKRPLRGKGDVKIIDLEWSSSYLPLHPKVRDEMDRFPELSMCHARWYQLKSPERTLICLHGWGLGYYPLDAEIFGVSKLLRQGTEVILFTLPFHGRRAPKGTRIPPFPSPSPFRSNEGFLRTVSEVRSLGRWLADSRDHIGLMGFSLGSFCSILIATAESAFSPIISIAPFSSLPAFLSDHGTLPKPADQPLIAEAFNVTSPLSDSRKLKLPTEELYIFYGIYDQVIVPYHAELLARKFSGCSTTSFPGSHLLPFGRSHFFNKILELLR